MARSLAYLKRILSAYVLGKQSQLSFWHEEPRANEHASFSQLGEYYMLFQEKAQYAGPRDVHGVILLNYHGNIGVQYNPIAIAQYGLAQYNRFAATDDAHARNEVCIHAQWLSKNLTKNDKGVPVWMHNFDFEYETTLRKPWYSGLAQGAGISLLVRAATITGEKHYCDVALQAACALTTPIAHGGTLFIDTDGNPWIEEYIISPPTHILNGFVWALWGLYDLWLVEKNPMYRSFFDACIETLHTNLSRYDLSWWSAYQLAHKKFLPMIASAYYHQLHIVQLGILARMTGCEIFSDMQRRWAAALQNPNNRARAFFQKALFKIMYY